MRKKEGFTLVEVLITVVILAVLAGVVTPGFSKSKAKAEADQAVAYLRTIRTAERMYYAKWGNYTQAIADTAGIKTHLSAETKTKGYAFSVTPTASGFTATATGSDGTISLDQDDQWSGTSGYLPGS